MICLMPAAMPSKTYQNMRLIRIVCCLLVVVIYIPVGIRMYQVSNFSEVQLNKSSRL